MTGGQRRLIVVDDEFDITVDGQTLVTLSGSANAVANLALRLGLGQVLANNVLSLFIGDEVDAGPSARNPLIAAKCLISINQPAGRSAAG